MVAQLTGWASQALAHLSKVAAADEVVQEERRQVAAAEKAAADAAEAAERAAAEAAAAAERAAAGVPDDVDMADGEGSAEKAPKKKKKKKMRYDDDEEDFGGTDSESEEEESEEEEEVVDVEESMEARLLGALERAVKDATGVDGMHTADKNAATVLGRYPTLLELGAALERHVRELHKCAPARCVLPMQQLPRGTCCAERQLNGVQAPGAGAGRAAEAHAAVPRAHRGAVPRGGGLRDVPRRRGRARRHVRQLQAL